MVLHKKQTKPLKILTEPVKWNTRVKSKIVGFMGAVEENVVRQNVILYFVCVCVSQSGSVHVKRHL